MKKQTTFVVIVMGLALVGGIFWLGTSGKQLPKLGGDKDTLFTDDGAIQEIRSFKDGKLDGRVTRYVDRNVREIAHYKDGKLDGNQTLFFATSLIEAEREYKKGVLEGISKNYNQSGNVIEEINYGAGVPDGEMIYYYANGAIRERITMVKGIKDGPFEEFNEIGELIASGDYRKGKRINRSLSDSGQVQIPSSVPEPAVVTPPSESYSDGLFD